MLSKKVKNRIKRNKLRRKQCADKVYRRFWHLPCHHGIRVIPTNPHAQPVNYLHDDEAAARRAERVAEVAKLLRGVVVVG